MPQTPKQVMQKRLKLMRLKKKTGLSNRLLAERLGVTERTIYYWLSGQKPMGRSLRILVDQLLRDCK